jgi:hypothetical protein
MQANGKERGRSRVKTFVVVVVAMVIHKNDTVPQAAVCAAMHAMILMENNKNKNGSINDPNT